MHYISLLCAYTRARYRIRLTYIYFLFDINTVFLMIIWEAAGMPLDSGYVTLSFSFIIASQNNTAFAIRAATFRVQFHEYRQPHLRGRCCMPPHIIIYRGIDFLAILFHLRLIQCYFMLLLLLMADDKHCIGFDGAIYALRFNMIIYAIRMHEDYLLTYTYYLISFHALIYICNMPVSAATYIGVYIHGSFLSGVHVITHTTSRLSLT